MNAADTEALRMALTIAGILGLVYLIAAVLIAVEERQQRTQVVILRADPAAWMVSQVMEDARRIIAEAALERGELAP